MGNSVNTLGSNNADILFFGRGPRRPSSRGRGRYRSIATCATLQKDISALLPANHMSGVSIIVIVGPTGSGKTSVAIEIAKRVGGEVISADSRAIYRGMDLGTAKPSVLEQDGVPHWGFDLVEPGERFTVADFKAYAEEKIKEIRGRGHVPIIAGGTGLYVDALIFDYKFLGKTGEKAAADARIEQKSCSDRTEMREGFTVFGIKTERGVLRERLEKRAYKLFTQEELFSETERLVKRYGWGNQAMKSNIYQFAWRYMNGDISLEEAVQLNLYDDWHLARRQMTWFKRNDKIRWYPLAEIEDIVVKYIQDEQGK